MKISNILLKFAVAFTSIALAYNSAQAQVLYGSLTGNVMDPSSAAIPNAKVEATNTDTGATRAAVTDSAGLFLFSNLQPGTYKLTVAATGFQTTTEENIGVEANQVRRADFQVQLAQATQTVEVNAAAVALQTDRADVNTTLERAQIANLPITSSAGRNFQALYKLVPGFSLVTESNSSDGGNPQRSMAGFVNGTSRQNSLTRIDGTSNTYMWLPSNTAYVPPAESIESVNIVTNAFDAEQGNAMGAAVNVVTKSGTNDFHGGAFEYHTDNALKALNRFNPAGFRKPKYIMNQYGGSVGGPIKKNKLFFFADWEATKRRTLASKTATVPNPAGIFDAAGNADLSAAIPAGTNCNAAPVAGCIFDPNTGNADGSGRQAFPGNIIPASRIDPVAKIMLSRINPAGFLNKDGVNANNNYNSTGSAKMDRNTVDTKVNYNPNQRMTVFGRYSISPTTFFDPPLLGQAMGGATGGGQVGTAPSRIQNIGLGSNFVITPNWVADVNGGYTRQRLGATYAPDLDLGNYGLTGLHIPGTNGDTYLAQGTPGFNFTQTGAVVGTWNGIGNVDTGNPFLFRDNQYVANANMSWTKGRHNVRYGIGFTDNGLNHFQPQGGTFQSPRGAFRFTGNVTALLGGPAGAKANSLADFLLGLPNEVGKAVQNSNPNSLRWRTWSWYVRDSWQVTSKLTVNYGLRWEFYPMATTDHGGVKLFDPSTGNVLIGGNGNVPLDDGVNVGHGMWLPRIGLAYRLDEKTVIRTGYGISSDSNNWRFFRNNYPATTNSDTLGATNFQPAASLTGETLNPYPGLPAGIPLVSIPDISSGSIPTPNGVQPGNTVPFNFRRGYIHSYNLVVQREIGKAVAEVGYVGNRGVRLLTNENINYAPVNGGNAGRVLFPVANKNWGDVNSLVPDGPSWYNSLQTKLSWRWRGNTAFGVVYTFSRAINWTDNEEEATVFGGQGGYLFWTSPNLRNRNKALASYDRTHNFSTYGSYDLPFGKTQRWAKSGVANAILGGWQTNWVLSYLSGSPFSIIGGGAQVNSPGNVQTADQVGPLNILGGIGPAPVTGANPVCQPADLSCHYFDPSAFAPVPGDQIRFGNTGRNIVRGPGLFNLDASVFRNFKMTERVNLQIRAEMFGVTNTPHYNNPGTDPTNPAQFGVITQTLNTAGRGTGTGGERQTWFSARVSF
ncbi:MAG: carboxypeptidase regulatory-like domain-containing protein [Bryobacterales bacterium]|nr:carboxypeptidase regulatory-like domain-containing protein [Bryobacterales bacterium]